MGRRLELSAQEETMERVRLVYRPYLQSVEYEFNPLEVNRESRTCTYADAGKGGWSVSSGRHCAGGIDSAVRVSAVD